MAVIVRELKEWQDSRSAQMQCRNHWPLLKLGGMAMLSSSSDKYRQKRLDHEYIRNNLIPDVQVCNPYSGLLNDRYVEDPGSCPFNVRTGSSVLNDVVMSNK